MKSNLLAITFRKLLSFLIVINYKLYHNIHCKRALKYPKYSYINQLHSICSLGNIYVGGNEWQYCNICIPYPIAHTLTWYNHLKLSFSSLFYLLFCYLFLLFYLCFLFFILFSLLFDIFLWFHSIHLPKCFSFARTLFWLEEDVADSLFHFLLLFNTDTLTVVWVQILIIINSNGCIS